MKIAVLSGKGGTDKTTVSASLVALVPSCQYIDCDVEEPNGAIFLTPELQESSPVKVLVPKADITKCNACGYCAKACQFNAIAVIKGKVLVFPEICHHCGTCVIACPNDAISEVERVIGVVEANGDDTFLQGKLNVGEPISIPIIRELKKRMKKDMPVVIDCSPGASCTVVQSIASITGTDAVVAVSKPTKSGKSDLERVLGVAKHFGIPAFVCINKYDLNLEMTSEIEDFCEGSGYPVIGKIAFDPSIVKAF